MSTATIAQPGIIRDDFAGPGGWSQACVALGLIEHGVEFDEAAVRTGQAAGHLRWLADVTERAVRTWEGWRGMWGYIASPPCQTFSAAGNGAGRKHLDNLVLAMKFVVEGYTPQEAVRMVADEELDERSVLVLEPLLVVRDHRPTWVALEQVPQVLPIWEAYAEILRTWGYSVWTGLLQAEQYGVPQTRKRAILMAHSEREVHPPVPTHSRYYPRDKKRLDPGVLPWVSMSTALNLAAADVSLRNNTSQNAAVRHQDDPAPTMYFGARMNGVYWEPGARARFAGAGATAEQTAGQIPRDLDEPAHTITGKGTAAWRLEDEMVMRSNYGTGGDPAARGERSINEPAPTVTSKVDRNQWQLRSPQSVAGVGRAMREEEEPSVTVTSNFDRAQWQLRGNQRPMGGTDGVDEDGYQVRAIDEPAMTVTSGSRSAQWQMGDVRSSRGTIRHENEPAATITGSLDNGNYRWRPTAANDGTTTEDMAWTAERPSPTVVGSFHPEVIAAPAYRKPGDGPRQKAKGSVRVTLAEAAVLQSFPPDYPWWGNSSKQFQQVGNAIPPLLAQAILTALLVD